MDEQNKNLILAMVLSLAVIFAWTAFFPPPEPATDLAAVPAATELPAPDTTAAGTSAGGAATTETAAITAEPGFTPATAPRVAIDTPRLSGSVSLLGGTFDDLLLRDYREGLDPASPEVRLLGYEGATSSTQDPVQPYYVNYGWSAAEGMTAQVPTASTLWSLEVGDTLTPDTPITLKWDNGAGLIFRRQIAVDENYMFTVTQTVDNQTGAAVKIAPYAIVLRQGAPKGTQTYVLHQGSVGAVDGKLHDLTFKAMTKLDPDTTGAQADTVEATTGGWIGLTDKYWMTTLIPTQGQPFTMSAKYRKDGDYYLTSTFLPALEVAPGASASSQSMLFAGAKEWEAIRAYQNNLHIERFIDAIDWGWFYFLTKPMFWLLHTLHGLIGNMGFAIIALTFLIKSVVFPLARKSYISMAKMKELQPEMEKLKEAAGEDKVKLQKGMMELYKKEKVNPASGCLPILLQIPIFYSLYKVIYVTIELRHAAWFGWLQDLSAPDPSSILNLFGLLPWATPEPGSFFFILSLGILPILLGISMWLQQKLNPAPTDPAQAMIFAWMPWVFMFMLGSFASGLVLYWITNNTITFLQQYTIMAMHGKRPDLFGNIKSGLASKKATGK